MFDLETAFQEWRRQMSVGGMASRKVLDELEAHLREDVEEQMTRGVNAGEAFASSVANMGGAAPR